MTAPLRHPEDVALGAVCALRGRVCFRNRMGRLCVVDVFGPDGRRGRFHATRNRPLAWDLNLGDEVTVSGIAAEDRWGTRVCEVQALVVKLLGPQAEQFDALLKARVAGDVAAWVTGYALDGTAP